MKRRIALALIMALTCSMTACAGKEAEKTAETAAEEETLTEEETAAEQTEEETAEEAAGEAKAAEESTDSGMRYQAEWTKDAVIYEVNVRQYTEEGTFKAFSEHLQTLKDMGINVLWFMPIHPISETNRSGTLGSYYSITDYRDVNPEFGTAEDFKALVDEAHAMGFHVMMDWVANHTGWDCAWISEHPEWYTQDSSGNIISPEGMGWPDVADLNYDSEELRAEMIECMKYWVQEYDIDGFRCDYATGVPQDFWEDARTALEELKPVYMLAEDELVEGLLEKAFDCNYNWNLYDSMREVARDAKKANTLKIYIPTDLPDGAYTLNFMDNHDKNSYEHTIMEAYGAEPMETMFSFLYMIPGVPMIYTGDEIGLDHAIAFMEKDAVDWESSEYDYRALLSELGQIKSGNPALYNGNYGGQINYYDLDNKNILCFYREKDGNTVKCLFNLSKREQTIDVSAVIEGEETVLLHGAGAGELDMEDHPVSEAGLNGEITVQPWEFWILSEGQKNAG